MSGLLALGSFSQQSCYYGSSAESYDELVKTTWRHTDKTLTKNESIKRELIRYATLSPSSHNTQCWKFKIQDNEIKIYPDFSRRCSVVDPDDHHIFSTLGCAAENLVQAAKALGYNCEVIYQQSGDQAVVIKLDKHKPISSPLFDAIPKRQCTRGEFDGKPLTTEELNQLKKAGSRNGVEVLLFSDTAKMNDILEYVVEGNTIQLSDPAFVKELGDWIRFSEDQVVKRRDGLFTKSSGNPTMPSWLGNRIFKYLLSADTENDKYAKQVRSSAGIAVFVSDINDREHWVEAGRCYERFALQATALGIRNAMLNQPVEVYSIRPQFASYLGIGDKKRPDLIVRFGRGPELPRSLRRPLHEVII
ncbi:MAG: Tat pathway signal protein [Candidatus Dadabacteria bacterium]|nr:Tat pathway signal protein [Candidatus Dadabacteria bacterium]NIS08236.1 Tat pathway signal protein [Candidatus Dadabacteria bacterium]NIV41503.1 Tat pathway signal protein [Candidatus Dadabacteria bacterium]NIY21724.1 Tat pathway signal protein [Candidatus Dadabacteria bacterium]